MVHRTLSHNSTSPKVIDCVSNAEPALIESYFYSLLNNYQRDHRYDSTTGKNFLVHKLMCESNLQVDNHLMTPDTWKSSVRSRNKSFQFILPITLITIDL